MSKYYVISNSEDGGRCDVHSKASLELWLNDTDISEDRRPKVVRSWKRLDEMTDTEILIIKGDIVTPTAVSIVTKFEVE